MFARVPGLAHVASAAATAAFSSEWFGRADAHRRPACVRDQPLLAGLPDELVFCEAIQHLLACAVLDVVGEPIRSGVADGMGEDGLLGRGQGIAAHDVLLPRMVIGSTMNALFDVEAKQIPPVTPTPSISLHALYMCHTDKIIRFAHAIPDRPK